MALSVNQYFQAVLKNLDLPDYQEDLVEARRSLLAAQLKSFVAVQRVFIAGSYKKRLLTAPPPGSRFRVDMFAVLSNDLYYAYSTRRNGQTQLLQYIRQFIARFPEYSRIIVKSNGRGMTLVLREFDAELVPCFALNGGGYYIPDNRDGGIWLPTYPEQQEADLDRIDSDYAYTLKPFIRLIRGWNQVHNLPLTGFMIEILVTNYLRTLQFNEYSYQSLIADFFDRFANRKVYSKYKTEDVLKPLNDAAKIAVKSKRITAVTDTRYARDAEERAMDDKANEYWHRIFGAYSA